MLVQKGTELTIVDGLLVVENTVKNVNKFIS